MGLCREMNAGIGRSQQFANEIPVADVAVHEIQAFSVQAVEVVEVARMGQRVQHSDANTVVVPHGPPDEVGADETGASCDYNVPPYAFLSCRLAISWDAVTLLFWHSMRLAQAARITTGS